MHIFFRDCIDDCCAEKVDAFARLRAYENGVFHRLRGGAALGFRECVAFADDGNRRNPRVIQLLLPGKILRCRDTAVDITRTAMSVRLMMSSVLATRS